MVEATTDLGYREFLALVSGGNRPIARLLAGESLHISSPLRYPGRRGAVVIELTPGVQEGCGPRPVRISDGGRLLRSLDEQGLDVSLDMIVSKTLVHAVKEVEGASAGDGEIFLDSDSDQLPTDVWRFLQLIAELLGLRHSKYKDALVQLSRRPTNAPDLLTWAERS